MIHSQPPSVPIIIQEKKVTVEELAGMVARGFKESERNMKQFIQVSIQESEQRTNERIDKLETNMNTGFTVLHKRIDSLETKIDSGLGSIHKRFDSLIVNHA